MLERVLYRPRDVEFRQLSLLLVPAHVAGAGVYSGVQTLLRAMVQLAAAHALRKVAGRIAHVRAYMGRLVNRLKGNFSVRMQRSSQTRVR